MRVGFLTYDLQEFTLDCLERVSAASPFHLRAYPVLSAFAGRDTKLDYRPSSKRGHFFTLQSAGKTPEGFIQTVNWSAAFACAWENDIIVLFGLQGGTAIVAALASKFLNKKLLSVNQTLPPTSERRRHWWVRFTKRFLLSLCDHHIVQTPITAKTLEAVYGISPDKMTMAPFEAGAGRYERFRETMRTDREEARKNLGIASGELIVLYSGTVMYLKGIDVLLDALASLSNPSMRAIFIGPDVSYIGQKSIFEYQKEADQKCLPNKVEFLGARSAEQLALYYQAADVFALPTRKDCWPKVLVEAAIFGLPLVSTTACGASGFLVEDGVTGYVVESDDAHALAEALCKLLAEEERKRMGHNAREKALAFCDARKEVEGFCAAINQLARNG